MRTKRAVRPEDLRKQKLRVWLQLLKTSRAVENEVRERFRIQFDTTLPRFDVLSALDRNPEGLKMSDLSRELKVSNGNTTTVVDRLVADGFAVRIMNDDDRRSFVARITPLGKRAFAAMAAQHESWIDDIMDSATVQRSADLVADLRALVGERAADK